MYLYTGYIYTYKNDGEISVVRAEEEGQEGR